MIFTQDLYAPPPSKRLMHSLHACLSAQGCVDEAQRFASLPVKEEKKAGATAISE